MNEKTNFRSEQNLIQQSGSLLNPELYYRVVGADGKSLHWGKLIGCIIIRLNNPTSTIYDQWGYIVPMGGRFGWGCIAAAALDNI